MPASERALDWDKAATLAAPLDLRINRRHMLALAGAAAAGVVLAAPALPISASGGSATAVTTLTLASLEVEQFLALIGETFTARTITGANPDTWARFVLADVSVPEPISGAARPAILRSQPFSLLFLLGAGSPGESGIIRFEHDALGKVELFVHQVLASDDAPLYEAVLN